MEQPKFQTRWYMVLPNGYIKENVFEISETWAICVFLKTQTLKPRHIKEWERLKSEGWQCLSVKIPTPLTFHPRTGEIEQ